jgi:hypothetical protein
MLYYLTTLQFIEAIGPSNFAGHVCDSTGNTKSSCTLITEKVATMLGLGDCCHLLHNTIGDITKLVIFDFVCDFYPPFLLC